MGARMECDAPDCSRTRGLNAPLSGLTWITVQMPMKAALHFHSTLCVAAWALAEEQRRVAVTQKRASA